MPLAAASPSPVTLRGSVAEDCSLASNKLPASEAPPTQVKLVSVVLRGERVREEEEEGEGPVLLMVMRPPDTKATAFLSCQVKAYSMSPASTTVLFTMAEQVRVTAPTPPAIRGPGDTERRREGGETAHRNRHHGWLWCWGLLL